MSNKLCSFTGCDRRHKGHGYCDTHLRQLRSTGEVFPIGSRRRIYNIICVFPNCTNLHKSGGYCSGHFKQFKLGYELSNFKKYYRYPNEWVMNCKNLRELIYCDPSDGMPYWKVTLMPWIKRNDLAGTECNGYRMVKINKKTYAWHRLMFLYFYGFMPAENEIVDHINGLRHDNRLDNLRVVTSEINRTNRDYDTGISKCPRDKWWVMCNSEEEARRIYQNKEA